MAQQLPGNYGVESVLVPMLSVVGGAVLVVYGNNVPSAMPLMVLLALLLITQAAFSLNMMKRGKFLIWSRLANGLEVDGDEMVLDVGCGLGLSTINIAKVLPKGEVLGIDRFIAKESDVDARLVAVANAKENGVAKRVEFIAGDPGELDFDDGSFDIVMTNGVLRTFTTKPARAAQLAEMWRTVAPGGRILLVDTQHHGEYKAALGNLGAIDIESRSLGLDGWSGSPFYASRLTSARKPPMVEIDETQEDR